MEQRVPTFSLRNSQYEKQPKAYGNSNCRCRTDKGKQQIQRQTEHWYR